VRVEGGGGLRVEWGVGSGLSEWGGEWWVEGVEGAKRGGVRVEGVDG
jgi:hypothetical protein